MFNKMNSLKLSNYSKIILYAILIILGIFIFQKIPLRLDLTPTRYFTLSSASVDTVKNLQEPLSINVFLSKSIPSPQTSLARDVRGILQSYSQKAGKNFNYNIYLIDEDGSGETKTGTSIASLANSYGIAPIQVQTFDATQATATSVYMGLVIEYLNQKEIIPNLAQVQGLNYENEITTIINKMTRINDAYLSLDSKIQLQVIYSPELQNIVPELGTLQQDFNTVIGNLNRDSFNAYEAKLVNLAAQTGDLVDPAALGLAALNNNQDSENPFYYGLTVSYGGKTESLNLIQDTLFGVQLLPLSEQVADSIQALSETLIGVNTTIGYVSSNGTLPRYPAQFGQQNTPSLSNYTNLLSENYTVESLDLDSSIPENMNTMIIAGPTEEFNDWELYQIDQYLMQGKKLLVFYNTYNEQQNGNQFQQSPPTYTANHTKLEDLLSHYGFNIDFSYVMDEKSARYQSQQPDGNFLDFPWYPAPKLGRKQINGDIAFLKDIPGLILQNVSPITVNEGLDAQYLFKSSDKAWKIADDINLYNPQSIFPVSADEQEVFDLGYLYEGKLNSYFAGKDIPIKPASDEEKDDKAFTGIDLNQGEEIKPFLASTENAGLVVIPSTMFVTNNFIDQNAQSGNAIAALGLVDSLSGREDFAVMRAKGQAFSLIEDDITNKKASLIKSLNIFGVPALILILGLAMIIVLKKRQLKIAAIYNRRTL